MAHDHDHGHGTATAGIATRPATFGRAFAVGIALNVGLVAAQIGVGAWAHSTALLADAVHNFGDVLGLAFAWLAAVLGRRRPTARRTYGWGRGSILAALANASVLLVGTGAIVVEAVQRLLDPAPVAGGAVMVVAAAAIVVNGGVALMFMRGRHDDLNIRGAFLHMAADAGVSAGVLVAAWLITLTGALWLDPVASLAISAVIVAAAGACCGTRRRWRWTRCPPASTRRRCAPGCWPAGRDGGARPAYLGAVHHAHGATAHLVTAGRPRRWCRWPARRCRRSSASAIARSRWRRRRRRMQCALRSDLVA